MSNAYHYIIENDGVDTQNNYPFQGRVSESTLRVHTIVCEYYFFVVFRKNAKLST